MERIIIRVSIGKWKHLGQKQSPVFRFEETFQTHSVCVNHDYYRFVSSAGIWASFQRRRTRVHVTCSRNRPPISTANWYRVELTRYYREQNWSLYCSRQPGVPTRGTNTRGSTATLWQIIIPFTRLSPQAIPHRNPYAISGIGRLQTFCKCANNFPFVTSRSTGTAEVVSWLCLPRLE